MNTLPWWIHGPSPRNRTALNCDAHGAPVDFLSMSSVRPGDVLAGKYRVERVLGQGGMGIVVAARHLQLDQLVALKFLRKGTLENDEASARFLREAKAAVKLKNEHIAKVFDVGTLESGEPYMVLEYLDGCDLSQLAKQRGAIAASEATEYVLQACEALAEAHSLGIIHRDIKLANLFVTRGPTGGPLVKVLDFGISKTNPFGESEHDMTHTTSMLGSPRFMSPEQMRDPRAVDGRTDIWSLGVVLYRLVAGRAPFEADTLGRLLTMVMHEREDPLAVVRPDLPPGLSEVVARCLEKEPEQRFANVAELAYALAPFCVDPQRGRASADRIAQMLSLAQLPANAFVPPSRTSGRISAPPNQIDTGTAAPWVGTHGSLARPPSPRIGMIGIGVVLAALLVGTGFFAKVRGTRLQREAAAATATTATPIVAPPPATSWATSPAPEATAPAATGSVIAASPVPTHAPAPVRTAPVTARPSAPKAKTTRPAAAKGDDGIPNSRD